MIVTRYVKTKLGFDPLKPGLDATYSNHILLKYTGHPTSAGRCSANTGKTSKNRYSGWWLLCTIGYSNSAAF